MNVGMMACYDQAKGTMMSVSQTGINEVEGSTCLSLSDPLTPQKM